MNETNRKIRLIITAALISFVITVGLVLGATFFFNLNVTGTVGNPSNAQITIEGQSGSYNLGDTVPVDLGILQVGSNDLGFTISNTGGTALTATVDISDNTLPSGYSASYSLPTANIPVGGSVVGTLILNVPADAVDGTVISYTVTINLV